MSAFQIILFTWLAGVAIIWIGAGLAYHQEPTIHGQGIIGLFGFIGGLFWPLVLTYLLLFAAPFAGLIWLFGEDKE